MRISGSAMSCEPVTLTFGASRKIDEHAVARVRGGLQHLPLRVGVDTIALRPGRADDDVLEAFDLLWRAVFADLEVGGGQVGDRLPVARRVDVDADQVRP